VGVDTRWLLTSGDVAISTQSTLLIGLGVGALSLSCRFHHCVVIIIIPPLAIAWPLVYPPSTQQAVAHQCGDGCSIEHHCRGPFLPLPLLLSIPHCLSLVTVVVHCPSPVIPPATHPMGNGSLGVGVGSALLLLLLLL
jgi:hypothetical protein